MKHVSFLGAGSWGTDLVKGESRDRYAQRA